MSRKETYAFFRSRLLNWYRPSQRPLPWKEETDPYLIWLSEIILQQTRVEQGAPYFLRFKQKYPTVRDLAAAPQDEVMKLWEGLGYYARARNMLEAARYVAFENDGKLPNSYQGLLKLKGVGPYTAAAIASFAFGLPHAVLDGNVFRVLSRFLGAEQPIDTTAGKRFFSLQAQNALDPDRPARYNQAIMDFGATVCRPQKPDCASCPLQSRCQAFQLNMIDRLPVKSKKMERRRRYFQFLVLNTADKVAIRKRTRKDIWRNLYEFPVLETEAPEIEPDRLLTHPTLESWLNSEALPQLQRRSKPFQQTLTHQVITATFWELILPSGEALINDEFLLVERKNLSNFAFPKIVDWYLGDNSLYLNLR